MRTHCGAEIKLLNLISEFVTKETCHAGTQFAKAHSHIKSITLAILTLHQPYPASTLAPAANLNLRRPSPATGTAGE